MSEKGTILKKTREQIDKALDLVGFKENIEIGINNNTIVFDDVEATLVEREFPTFELEPEEVMEIMFSIVFSGKNEDTDPFEIFGHELPKFLINRYIENRVGSY